MARNTARETLAVSFAQNCRSVFFALWLTVAFATSHGCNSNDSNNHANTNNSNQDTDTNLTTSGQNPTDQPPVLTPIDESIDVEGLLDAKPSTELLDLGWINLFDGQSLMGWQSDDTANWRVEGDQIVADSGEPSILKSTTRFADFELMVEFLADPTTNSGIFMRMETDSNSPGKDCYELNIANNDHRFPLGSLVNVKKTDIGTDFDYSKWHTFHALVDGPHVQIWLDGKLLIDLQDDPGLQSGFVGLQFRNGPIRFRQIRLRPILLDQVLPAKSLDRWTIPETSNATFEIGSDERLTVTGGRAHAELLQPLGNFILQFESTTLSENANSGLFFRCIPGSEMNGYECQINHQFIEDRRRPADWGTGGIFRRQPARVIPGNDNESTYVTIAAFGNRIATWVNGIQTVDFVDSREPHENPRLGRRDKAGSIMIQAHDPDSAISFGQLRMMETPAHSLQNETPNIED